MDKSSLNTNLHKVIDTLDDKELLERFYQEAITLISNFEDLWSKLSKEQQQEVLKSFEESNKTEELVAHDKVMERYKDLL